MNPNHALEKEIGGEKSSIQFPNAMHLRYKAINLNNAITLYVTKAKRNTASVA